MKWVCNVQSVLWTPLSVLKKFHLIFGFVGRVFAVNK